MKVSLVVPAFNEQGTIKPLIQEAIDTFKKEKIVSEIIIVDDGSTDKTREISQHLSNEYKQVRLISYKKNRGKSYALMRGFHEAKGDVIVFIDADLEQSPKEIPLFLDKINQGYDVVNGWRKQRKHGIGKRFFSWLYNKTAYLLFKVKIHDLNCGFKAFTREAVGDIDIKKGYHRYMVCLLGSKGYKVAEIEVKHKKRKSGKSKYGSIRLLLGFLDLITVKMVSSFSEKPMLLFGTLGIFCTMIGFAFGLYLFGIWLQGQSIGNRPLLSLSVLLVVLGVQFFGLGFLAEKISDIEHKIRKEK